MHDKFNLDIKTALAYITLEWLLTSVGSHFYGKSSLLIGTVLTYITLEWLFPSVSSHVYGKSGFSCVWQDCSSD